VVAEVVAGKFMKKIILLIIFLFLSACLPQKQTNLNINNIAMKITSPAFEHNKNIPAKYTCDGENINPPLQITEIPNNTQSLVLISDDPDAPMGTWVHWTIWNISPQTENIAENSSPSNATEGLTSFGKPGYGGPCPPSGTHRYFFKIYALDTNLELSVDSKKDDLEQAMANHVLDSAELIGLYQRQ